MATTRPLLRQLLGPASVGVALGLVTLGLLAARSREGQPAATSRQRSLAGLDYERFDGSSASFDGDDGGSRRGGVTVVNFWSPSCPPCVEELPTLAELDRDLDDRVEFVGISNVGDPAAVRMAADSGVTYELGADPDGELFASAGLSALPSTVLLGPDATVVDVIPGAVDPADLQQRIERALTETRSRRGS